MGPEKVIGDKPCHFLCLPREIKILGWKMKQTFIQHSFIQQFALVEYPAGSRSGRSHSLMGKTDTWIIKSLYWEEYK